MGGGQETKDDRKRSSKQLKYGAGFRSDIILATEPRIRAVPDRGWNNNTS